MKTINPFNTAQGTEQALQKIRQGMSSAKKIDNAMNTISNMQSDSTTNRANGLMNIVSMIMNLAK